MTRKQLEERRKAALELTRQDRANRCPVCLRPFGETTVVESFDAQRYCSSDCLETKRERELLEKLLCEPCGRCGSPECFGGCENPNGQAGA